MGEKVKKSYNTEAGHRDIISHRLFTELFTKVQAVQLIKHLVNVAN